MDKNDKLRVFGMQGLLENRNYYCLISGLPDIVLEQSKAPFTLSELIDELHQSLHPEDFHLVELILLPYENSNLRDLAGRTDAPWHPWGKHSREELEEKLREPGLLPAYQYRFYQAFKGETPLWQGMSWENQLTRLYYDFVMEETSGFLRAWFSFERSLKNLLVAWNCRAFHLPPEGQLIGDDEVTQALLKSHARDFGLSKDLELVDKVLHALERDDLLEREKAIDRIKWNYLDALNTFNYFSIEVVLGYLLQFLMLDRWLRLDPEKGERIIADRIAELERSYEFNEKRP